MAVCPGPKMSMERVSAAREDREAARTNRAAARMKNVRKNLI
jgi:hypothetical protein